MSRRLFFTLLRTVRHGRIEVEEAGCLHSFGPADADLRAKIRVHHPACWRALLRGSTGMAESYAHGLWDCDDLVALVRIAARELRRYDRQRELLLPLQRLARLVPHNSRRGARRNIAAHYDIGDDLFSLFLDESMSYSSALFEHPDMDLEAAQHAKIDQACRRLELRPDDHLLEIGSGWGALAIHAATRYGCRVTTTTISQAQFETATRRVRDAGLERQVTVLLSDYRDLRGSFDKLISIEMIEAVGWQYFEIFFRRCSELLTPEGLMLLQAITIEDSAYEAEKASRSFINKHIFPGGCLPSLEVIARMSARAGLEPLAGDDLTDDYAETLLRWREAFTARAGEAAELGYDRRFRRLWEMYLCYVEAGFRERRIGDYQLLFAGSRYLEPGSRSNARSVTASSRNAGPREASLASAVLPPGPST
jgi:cyclopropane-fatty-acyl-phospholipid synthase